MKADFKYFICILIYVSACHAQAPAFMPSGELEAASGTGVKDQAIYYREMRFPLEKSPAFSNSQVYRKGGSHGPKGAQCDTENYQYPWRDNFCEARGHPMPICPAGTGHQGQDIRPATCQKNTHWAVAAEGGIISHVGTYSITLLSSSGTIYRYLHLQMDDLAVRPLQKIKKGERIGKVSNSFGDSKTTIHLHFDIKDAVTVNGKTGSFYIPPYASLVESYKRLIDKGH